MERKTGTILKELRKNSNLSVQDVLTKLRAFGEEIQAPTLYAYENNTRAASADMLLALCQIYDCNNILETFSGVKPDYSIPSDDEWIVIEKYRQLDGIGQNHVNSVLGWELERTQAAQEQSGRIDELQNNACQRYFMTYYQKLASAGTGEYLFDDVPTDTIEVPYNEISAQADFVIGVNGDSMEPDYYDGEKVYVRKTDDLSVGKVGIFVQGNECFIKEKGTDCLISRNKDYPDIIPASDIRLIGEVIGKLE